MSDKGIKLNDMSNLIEYYNNYDEEGRLLSRHGQVEYLTTMKYIEEYLGEDKSKRILEASSCGSIEAVPCIRGYAIQKADGR